MLLKEAFTVLAVESSAGPASCALLRVENERQQLLASSFVNTGLTHSQTLLPMIEHTLGDAGLSFDSVDTLAVSVGPGSFTGVRIGVSTVKGLAFAQNLPCVPISTLAGMARRWEDVPFTGRILAAMDARCRQIYTATFLAENGVITRLTPDEALPMEEVKTRLLSEPGPILLIGDGAEVCYKAWQGEVPGLQLAPPEWRYQHAVGVAREAVIAIQKGETVSGAELLPAYLRLPQAERELRRKQQQQ